jgi:Cys-tRNA(Pro)/Cys-tRNA(Cys) deacylase
MAMRNQVTRYLDKHKIPYQTHQLPGDKLSAEEAARYLNVAPATVYKTIVTIERKSNRIVLALVPAQTKVDLKALARYLQMKKIHLTTQREAEQLTGLQTGGISPLALLHRRFTVVLDRSALDHPQMYLSGGDRGLNIQLAPGDLITSTGALCFPISTTFTQEVPR